jgi:hypothetical protein
MLISTTVTYAHNQLNYCGDFRPYFTIHDSEFREYTSPDSGSVHHLPMPMASVRPHTSLLTRYADW